MPCNSGAWQRKEKGSTLFRKVGDLVKNGSHKRELKEFHYCGICLWPVKKCEIVLNHVKVEREIMLGLEYRLKNIFILFY